LTRKISRRKKARGNPSSQIIPFLRLGEDGKEEEE